MMKTINRFNQFTSRTLAKTIRKRRAGCPDMDKASTSVVERTNLNLRHFVRRFTRCSHYDYRPCWCGCFKCMKSSISISKDGNKIHATGEAANALFKAMTTKHHVEPQTLHHLSAWCDAQWPSKFRKHTKEGTPAFARQAVRRIEWFIETKGTDKK